MKRDIIDCHCHIYPDKIAEKASHAIGEFYDLHMDGDGKIASMLDLHREAGIDRCLVFSVATKPEQTASINEYIASVVSFYGDAMRGMGTIHPDNSDPAADIDHLLALGLVGLKMHPDFQKTALDDPRMMRIYEICEGRIPVCVHTGDKRYDYSNPGRLSTVLRTFPRLTVIGAHFGGYSVWDEAERTLPDFDNLLVDCSSSLAFLTPARATELVRAYGAERVLFGSDYPMWRPTDEVARFDALSLDEGERKAILHKNAERVFGFTPRG